MKVEHRYMLGASVFMMLTSAAYLLLAEGRQGVQVGYRQACHIALRNANLYEGADHTTRAGAEGRCRLIPERV